MPRKRSRRKRKSAKVAPAAPPAPALAAPAWLVWLDERAAGWSGITCAALAFLIPFILYLATAMREPGIHGDYVKFALLGKIWGIPHSPGFPLYLILDGIVSRLPIGTLTFRVAALSATCVALAMHLTYRVGRQLSFPPLLALGVALLAATGRSVWLQGIIPEVYGLHLLLIIASLWALFRWDDTGDDRWVWTAIWLYMLSLANHPTALFAFPGLVAFPIARKLRVFLRGWTWFHILAAVLVVAALYGYIFFRSTYQPLHNEGHIGGDLHRFWYYLRAMDYAKEWSHYDSAARAQMWQFFMQAGKLALTQIGWFAAWAGVIASAILSWRRALPLVLVPAGLALSNFLFHTVEPESYFAACFPFAALLAGSLVVLLADLADRFLSPKKKDAPGSSLTSVGILTIVLFVLVFAVLSHIGTNLKQLNFSEPNPEYARATRITAALETPALVFTSHYKYTMLIRYCLWADELRDDGPIATTQTWDLTRAQEALTSGKHVYIFGERAGYTRNRFSLRRVDTGSLEPELYELGPPPDS